MLATVVNVLVTTAYSAGDRWWTKHMHPTVIKVPIKPAYNAGDRW